MAISNQLVIPEGAIEIAADSPEAIASAAAPRQEAISVRAIPAAMWAREAENIAAFITSEISSAEAERDPFFRKVARWEFSYEAPMPTSPKNFPIANASNLTVPFIKETHSTLTGQLVQSTMTAKPRWVLTDLAPEWDPFVDPIERFLDLAAVRELEYDDASEDSIDECAKVGTAIVEVGYLVDILTSYRYTSDGKSVYAEEVIAHDGPIATRIPLQNFWIRMGEEDLQKAKWVAKELWLTEDELRAWEQKGRFVGVDRLIDPKRTKFRDEDDEKTRIQEEMEETEPTQAMHYQIFEVHLKWNIDGASNGRAKDIVVYYHKDTGIFLGAFFANLWSGKRPFVKFGFRRRPGRFYDQGLAEMLEQIQAGISSKHNKRNDNETLANLKMFVTRTGTKGLRSGDPLYSGKVMEMNDPFGDVRELQMSEIYPSTVLEEDRLRGYGDRLVGMSEAASGSAGPTTRTTATAELALLQEQTKRHDRTVRNIRRAQNEIGQLFIDFYQQYGTLGKGIAWLGQPGKAVEAIFSLPRAVVEMGAGLRVNVPTSSQNRQVKKENAIQMFNLQIQAYQQLIPLVGQLAGPEALAPVVKEMVKGAKKFMGDAFETFETSDPEEMVAGLDLMARILPSMEDLGGLQANEKAEQGAKILEEIARVENLYREAEGASPRGPGRVGESQLQLGGTSQNTGEAVRPSASLFLGGSTS